MLMFSIPATELEAEALKQRHISLKESFLKFQDLDFFCFKNFQLQLHGRKQMQVCFQVIFPEQYGTF